jgi:hypothetical protein
MSHFHLASLSSAARFALAMAVLAVPCVPAHAATQVEERRPAIPQGSVEIINLAGEIDIAGWDKPEVQVSGTIGSNVERVDVSGDGNRTTVRVVLRSQHNWGSGSESEAHLSIHVPTDSSLSTSLVSSDLKVSALRGDAKLQTVSGNLTGDTGGNVHANTVSGNISLTAAAAKSIEVKSVSGNIELTGGDADTEITSVSGDAKITLKTPARLRLQTVSGTLTASLAVGPDAQIDAESVSGDVHVQFASTPAADFDIQSFSGEIANCFGPKPTQFLHGAGSRLTFKSGESRAQVRVTTKSGDVRLCAKG